MQWKVLFVGLFLGVFVGAYNDEWARQLLSISAAGFATDPIICVKKTFPESNWILMNNNVTYDPKIKGNVTTFAITNHEKKKIIISFAVNEPKDLSEFKSVLESMQLVRFHDFGNVQSLFFELEEEIWKFVHQVIGFQDYRDHDVTFTGYSLGGAIATLAAMRAISDGLRKSSQIELITFGEPRVGTLVFANSVNREIPHKFRITHRGDPVVHLPPCVNLGNISCSINQPNAPSHHGTEVFYNNDMRYGSSFLKCTAKEEDEQCSNSMDRNLNFKDHEFYFQHKVISYGTYDCTDVEGVDNEPSSSRLSAVLSVLVLLPLINYY